MLARRSTLAHPIGSAVDLPRLVPSFSSKGFPFFKDDKSGELRSEASEVLELTGPTINDSILVSAYDVHHNYIYEPERFYDSKEIIFIDSGGYELSPFFDSTEPKHGPHKPTQGYGVTEYHSVLAKLPENQPIVITNFDHDSRGKEIEFQILEAQKIFNEFPGFAHDFLIKPTGQRMYINIDEIDSHLSKMRKFNIIGLTEKELGSNLLEKLINIARLRLAMDRKSIGAPLHIWGGLDPVISPLYFFAGAEIFDGVSWLRYGYCNDIATTRDAYIALELGVHTQWRRAEALRCARNISYLEDLTIRMQRFVDEGGVNFEMFGTYAEKMKNSYETLSAKVPELRGGA